MYDLNLSRKLLFATFVVAIGSQSVTDVSYPSCTTLRYIRSSYEVLPEIFL